MIVQTILIVGSDGADSDRGAVAERRVDGVFSGIDAHVLIYHLASRCAESGHVIGIRVHIRKTAARLGPS